MTREFNQQRALAWLMWLLTTSFFAYQFILRISPGLIINDIMKKFNIDAGEYGNLSAMYYYGYAAMQIPIAVLIDKYGPKIIGFIAAFVCATACIIFIYSDSWYLLLICRLLIGIGSAAGFLNVSKVISLWFDPKFYGRMVGITFSLGLAGAVYGGKPISSLISTFGWNTVLLYVGIAGLAISLLILLLVKNNPYFIGVEDAHLLDKMKKICSNWHLITLGVANFLMVGALEGFADVWGVPYLVTVFSYTKSDAAFVISLVFIGMIFGGPLIAYIAEKTNSHYMLTVFCGIGIAAIFFVMLLLQNKIPMAAMYIMMFMVGVFCCYQVLVFTIVSASLDAYLISIAIAFMNSVNMLGGSFFHTTIGRIMNYFWQGKLEGTLKIYNADGYNYSLMVIPISAVIGAFIVIIVRLASSMSSNNRINEL